MTAALEHARHEWAQGHRRLQELAGDPRLYRQLLAQVDAVTTELRRRVGQTFTLAELAEAYASSEAWGWDTLSHGLRPSELAHAATVEDAAFHIYSRGAVDYQP